MSEKISLDSSEINYFYGHQDFGGISQKSGDA